MIRHPRSSRVAIPRESSEHNSDGPLFRNALSHLPFPPNCVGGNTGENHKNPIVFLGNAPGTNMG
jgi:hypothetical protein